VGEQVLVRLRIEAARSLRHLVIEDPRVSGFEVDALLPEGAERPWTRTPRSGTTAWPSSSSPWTGARR